MEKRFVNETEVVVAKEEHMIQKLQMKKIGMEEFNMEESDTDESGMDETIDEYLAFLNEEDSEQEEDSENKELRVKADEDYIGNSMELYLKDMEYVKRLTEEEELELGKQIAEGGEIAKEAAKKLAEGNIRLALFFAKDYKMSNVPLEDINMMACEGLMRAAEKFDYTKGVRFSTYAAWWIKQAIRRGITNEASVIRKPVHMNEAIMKVKKAQKKLEQKLTREATVDELTEATGLPKEQVENAMKSMVKVVSFDAKLTGDGDTTLLEMVADQQTADVTDTVMEDGLKNAIRKVLSELSEKEAMVISLRFGIGGDRPMTLEEIGKLPQFKVSRERVRQIELKAMRKLRFSPAVRRELLDFAC